MSNVHSVGQGSHDEPGLQVAVTEVRAPEVGVSTWLCPQAVVRGDIEEGERWDGLS
jgi:hypothetical protein